jgi:hypothetical protein
MAEVPTVRIVFPHASGEWATINLSDFDPTKHVLFDERPPEAPIQDDVSRETSAPRKRGRPRKDA